GQGTSQDRSLTVAAPPDVSLTWMSAGRSLYTATCREPLFLPGYTIMWIVRLALRRPYTFVVMAVLIAILGGTAIVSMPVDIFPYIDIPIVSVLWVYQGLSPEEMEKRVVTGFERTLTSNVNDIEHIESQAYNGYAVVRIYFHPNVKVDMAVAQVTATMQSGLRQMPPGMFPANVLKYDAAS